jgi:hypothetical protein
VRFDTYKNDSNDEVTLTVNEEENPSGKFNLFEQKIIGSGINDAANSVDGYYNNLNYSHQISELTALYYYPSEKKIAAKSKINFSFGNPKWVSIKDIAV